MIAGTKSSEPARRVRRGIFDGRLPKLVIWTVIAQAVLILAGLWGYTAWRLSADRERTLEAGRQELRTIVIGLHAHVEAVLSDGLGAATAAAQEVLARDGGHQLSDAQVAELLERRLTSGQYIRALFFSTPERFVRVTRNHQPRTAARPPQWLQPAFIGNDSGTYVGQTLADPENPSDSVVPVALHMKSASGETVWIGVLLGVQALNHLYESIAIESGALVLLSETGQSLLRVPALTADQWRKVQNFTQQSLRLTATLGDEGFVTGTSPATGTQWTYAVRRVAQYRLRVVAGRPVDSILAPWRERSAGVVKVMAGFSLLLIGLTASLRYFISKLERREFHYRTLFNNSAVSVFLMSGDTFLEANATTYKMFRVPDHRPFNGIHPWDISPPRQPDGSESMVSARARIEAAQSAGQLTFRWTHKRMDTDEPFAAEVSLSSMQIGDTSLMLAIVHDLTELERAQRQLQSVNGDLEQANSKLAALNADLEHRVEERTVALQNANLRMALTNQELEAFTASASHDLRSPLGAIAGHAGLLQDELQPNMSDSVRHRIGRITGGVKRCSDIIDGLLSLARLAQQELLIEPVDMTALARACVDELRQQYPDHPVDCSIPEGIAVHADPRLMKSLLTNLLGNAWKYTSRSPNAAVELRCVPSAQTPVFSIRDNGAGFNLTHAERIFQPFHRLHSAAEFPGIGIGLATVARIVQRYGGKIWVESEPGKGAVFYFTLPAAAPSVPEHYPDTRVAS